MRAERYWRRVEVARRQLEAAENGVRDAEVRLAAAEQSLRRWREARDIVQEAAQGVQTAVHSEIADLVTRCLRAVFGKGYGFAIEFDRKRGKTEARMFFTVNGHEVDPKEESGLGAVDVAAFALRLACLKLHRPAVAPVMVLDENFKWLDSINRPRVAELLMKLSEETGVQIILISHDTDFQVGKVIRIA